ncbi:MAG: hypothetical protein OHM56_02545 [Spiroplasma phoeniceum]|nr:MAG: hypothetical protein OHM57_01990 [Spiroplasma phoeniceum]UZQ32851.1 MAG: hypothetical protein OHM56_02545 [Spiroplasma phoeniceum]
MPIGTSKTALIYAVKKNPTRLSIQQQEKSFGLQLLEFLGIQVLALGLSVLTGGIGKLTRAARTTRILKLAKETKLLEKLGVITANNLEDVGRQVTGKKILSDKLIFDFTKQANNETLLYTIGKLARNDFYKGFKVSNLETIDFLRYLVLLLKYYYKI